MSIRMLAVELYRAKREVDELEKKLKDLPPGAPRDELVRKLMDARAEKARLKAMLDGAKE